LIVMLDQLGIDRTVAAGLPAQLALIDLPDTDSTVDQHRKVVEDLFPHLDLVIWVVDPEKYHDRVWHEQWLRPHSQLHERFRFVLNQADRLSPDEVADITIDLTAALEEDGIPLPQVVITAADPAAGPPIGTEFLLEEFDRVARAKETAPERMRVDLSAATRQLVAATNFAIAGWEPAVRAAAERLASGDAPGACDGLHALLEQVTADLPELEGVDEGWDDKVAALVVPSRRWWQRWRRRAASDASDIAAGLERALGPDMRRRLGPRAAARAAVAELQVDLMRLEVPTSARARDDHP
jgi:hypothetical protein